MRLSLLLATTLLLSAGCSGGGGSSPAPAPHPTATPTSAPTTAPTTAPQRTVRGAPLSANPATLQSIRRAEAIGSTPNFLVEGAGASGVWGGDFVVWVTDDTTGADVAETSATTTTNPTSLLVNDPPMETLCTGPNSAGNVGTAWCNAHPTAWVFGTSSDPTTKSVGKDTINVAFSDGTSAVFTDYVYAGWSASCGESVAFTAAGVNVVSSNGDLTYDCANQAVEFSHGYALAAAPQVDAYGRSESVLTTVTAPVTVPTGAPTSIPFASFTANAVYVTRTSDGGFVKIYSDGASALNLSGLALHAQSDGSYAF